MKKSISLIIALAMVLGIFLVGCNEKSNQSSESKGTNAEANNQTPESPSESEEKSSEAEPEKETEPEQETEPEETSEAEENATEDKQQESDAVVEEIEKDQEALKGSVVWRETGGKVVTLNNHVMKTDAEMSVMEYCYGNMLAVIYNNGKMEFVPDHAVGLPTSNEDGTEWTFKINPNAKWANGEPITAKTYEYSYKMLLDPKLKNYRAIETFDQKVAVVNARKYWLGKSEDNVKIQKQKEEQEKIDKDREEAEKITDEAEKEKALAEIEARQNELDSNRVNINEEELKEGGCEWSEVGIKAPDDETLIITLAYPVPKVDFLLHFTGGSATSPVREDLYEAGMSEDKTETTYGTSFESTPSSGAYKLTKWVRDQVREYERNPNNEFGKKYMVPDKIYSRVVQDNGTQVQLFEKGKTDAVGLFGENYAKYEEDPRLKATKKPQVWSMYINMTTDDPEKAFLKDKDFRHALSYATNRDIIASKILKKDLPACYPLASAHVIDFENGTSYRDTEQGKSVLKEYPNHGFDPDRAKELFDKAYDKFGKGKMVMECFYFDHSDAMKGMAEFMKEEYENLFGKDRFEFKLRAMPWNQCYDMYEQGKYDAGFGAWGGEIFNPWALLETYTSHAPMKCDQMKNPRFDELNEKTLKGDLVFKPKERLEALAEMEQILLDEMPIMPIYESTGALLYSDRVKLPTEEWIAGVGFAALQGDLEPLQ